MGGVTAYPRVAAPDLEAFCRAALEAAGADAEAAAAAGRALVQASLMGTDSHGVRLLPHYVAALQGGRIRGHARLRFRLTGSASAYLDAGDALGHLAGFRAMERAVELAGAAGVGAVSVGRSSHFGAAGCYALAAAERGCLGLAVCNSDAFVRLHEGVRPFHGTNPIAFAAPGEGVRHYLLDMASSAIPWNRVQQYGAAGRELPADVAADAEGRPTTDPARVASLHPLGGAGYGYKGAGLAGMVEILSSVLSGMQPGHRLLPMAGPDLATPRGIGHFFLALRPSAFVSEELYRSLLAGYLADLRAEPAVPGGEVLAPGDREWRVRQERKARGIPLEAAEQRAFRELAERLGVPMPKTTEEGQR